MSNYESYFIQLFKKEGIFFEREKTFKNLKKGKYRYDFYIPYLNILLEIDGQYHFQPIRGRINLNKQQNHDREKNDYALINKIKLYRIPYWDIDKIKKFQDILQDKYLVKSKFHNEILIIENNIPRY